MKMRLRLLTSILTILPALAQAQSVVTYHNSLERHGRYTVPGLTLAAAAAMHLDGHFEARVEGHGSAQPLY